MTLHTCKVYMQGEHNVSKQICGSRIVQDRGIIEVFKEIPAEHNRSILEYNPPRPSTQTLHID